MRRLGSSVQSEAKRSAGLLDAANGLALVRVTIGAMFVWVFFENLGKGTYTTGGYAGVINYYIKNSHSPEVWKAVMGLVVSNAAIAAPLQALTEISLGVLLVIGLFTRQSHSWLFCFSAAFGFRSSAHRGYGNCWFRYSPALGSRSDAQAGDGALIRCWHNGGRPRCGGDLAHRTSYIRSAVTKPTCACRSLFPPTMKRRQSAASLQISPLISSPK